MSRKRMGAMDTTTTLLLVGGGIFAIYMLTKPKVTMPIVSYPPGYVPPSTANPTTAIANDATSVLNNILNMFS